MDEFADLILPYLPSFASMINSSSISPAVLTYPMLFITRVQAEIHGVVLHLSKSSSQYFIRRKGIIPSLERRRFCSDNDSTRTVEASLISIFTKRPFSPESPVLQELSLRLTPQVVETVLKSLNSWRLALSFFDWASKGKHYSHNCYVYNAMAAILSNSRQKEPLRLLSEQALVSGCNWMPGAFGYFLRCLGSQGLLEEANSLFDQVRILGLCSLNGYSYNCLLEVIAKRGDVALLEYRLNEMKLFGWPIDKHALTPALQCYCNAGMFDKAFTIFNELSEKGWVDQHVLGIAVISYSKSGEVNKAFELIEWAEKFLNIRLNEKTLCILIHGFSRESRADKALDLYYKMRRFGFIPDISVYDVLIRGFCKRNETETAVDLLGHMKESGISPDSKIIVEILLTIHDDGEMIQLLEDSWKDLNTEKKMLLFRSVVEDLINAGYVVKAHHLLMFFSQNDLIKIGGANSTTHSSIEKLGTACFETAIDSLCKDNKLDMALDLFRVMNQCGYKCSVSLFNDVINCLSKGDRLIVCFDLLTQMKQANLQPTHFTFNCILGCLCRRADVAGSLAVIREMRCHGFEPWIKNYVTLVKQLCREGKTTEALNFLSDMSGEGFLPDMIAYSAVIDGFVSNDELDHGLKLFRRIREQGRHPDVVTYNTIIKGLCMRKRMAEAEDVVNDILDGGLVPSVVTYNSVIDGWGKVGDTDEAIKWFFRMVEDGQQPNVITYSSLVNGLCNAGKADEAVGFWIEMEDKGIDPNRVAYMGIINGLCKCGRPDVGMIYLQEMEGKGMLADAYIHTALSDALDECHDGSDPNTPLIDQVLDRRRLITDYTI